MIKRKNIFSHCIQHNFFSVRASTSHLLSQQVTVSHRLINLSHFRTRVINLSSTFLVAYFVSIPARLGLEEKNCLLRLSLYWERNAICHLKSEKTRQNRVRAAMKTQRQQGKNMYKADAKIIAR